MGYEILQPIASLEMILDGVLYHHEYPDGSGYPEGLSGDEIPLVARIIHVADTFDALTSTRSYRKAFSIEKAVEIIMGEADVRTDRKVAEAFFRAFDRYRESDPIDFEQRFTMLHERECENAGV
jgi:HD-GYP domain-containing protein (c-di-GMP phosphodiesterase class II)